MIFMQMRYPEELRGKIHYVYLDVAVKDGVKLTPKEQEIFEKFRIELKEAHEDRFK